MIRLDEDLQTRIHVYLRQMDEPRFRGIIMGTQDQGMPYETQVLRRYQYAARWIFEETGVRLYVGFSNKKGWYMAQSDNDILMLDIITR